MSKFFSKNRALSAALMTFFLLAPAASAQTAAPPVNVASFANPNLPNGKIAQGSMFEIFGTGIAAAGINLAADFPLPTTLAGSSIQVTVSGQTIDAVIVRTLNNDRVAAILPSDTPVGAGTLVVRYNGAATAPAPIEVVAHSFGAFTLNSAGSGPAVLTDATTYAVNTLLTPHRPGDLIDLWGTGLGAAPYADDIQPPPGVDFDYTVQVSVGGQPAEVLYRGRSGCCSGVDIVRFRVPTEISGCHLPVLVTVNGRPSNSTTMSVSADGGACSDPGGLSTSTLTKAQETGAANIGVMMVNRVAVVASVPGFGQEVSMNTDSAAADFYNFTADQLIRFEGLTNFTPVGACEVFQFFGQEGDKEDPILGTVAGIDVGTVSVAGPNGTQQLDRDGVGSYFKQFASSLPNIPGLSLSKELTGKEQFGGSGTAFLRPGEYTFNISGGSGVGPGSASINVPTRPTTNIASITTVNRSNSLRVTYSPSPQAEFIQVMGLSVTNALTDPVGAMFLCHASASAGSFDVPASVLSLLPASDVLEGTPIGYLGFGVGSFKEASIPGLDQSFITQMDLEMRTTRYQ